MLNRWTMRAGVVAVACLFPAACAKSDSGGEDTTLDAGLADGALHDAGGLHDSAIVDASVTPDSSGAQDTGVVEAEAVDGAPPDAGIDSSADDANAVDASNDVADSADGADSAPLGQNLARETGATASATSTYSSGFDASKLVDDDIAMSWYADTGACAPATAPAYSCGTAVSVTITLAGPRSVGSLVIYGNRDYAGYDVLTGRWEILDGASSVIATRDVALSPPNYDLTTSLSPVAGASAVRFVIETADASGPGIGEIQIYAN